MVTAPFADRLAESDAACARGPSEEPPYNGERVLCGTGKAGTEQLAIHASPTRFGKCSAVKHPSGAAFKELKKLNDGHPYCIKCEGCWPTTAATE